MAIRNGKPYTEEGLGVDDALISERDSFTRDLVLEWIRDRIKPSMSINYRHSSFGIKRIFERETGVFITDNEFKEAMMLSGYKPESDHYMNWYFRISNNSPAFVR